MQSRKFPIQAWFSLILMISGKIELIRLILEAIPNKADKRLVCVSLFKVGTNDSVLAILSYYSH